MTPKKDDDKMHTLENRTTIIEQKVNSIDEKLDTILNKINGFVESAIDLRYLQREYEKSCIKNDMDHKNFISKVGFYTVSTILGIIVVGIAILNFALGRWHDRVH